MHPARIASALMCTTLASTVLICTVLAWPLGRCPAQHVVGPHPQATDALQAGRANNDRYVAAPHLLASNIVTPQVRGFAMGSNQPVRVTAVAVGVVILDRVATTTMDISLLNLSPHRQEAQMLVPVPAGAVVRGFSYEGTADEPTASLLPAEQARRTYQGIVARTRDPALLEFAGLATIRSSVFPLEPRGTQKVRLTYEHLLPADGSRVDYVLPRTESLDYSVPWTISVKIKAPGPISTVYSPSHDLQVMRSADNVVSSRITEAARTQPGPFRLSYLLQQDGVTASLLAYPDGDGGYFLLLGGLPAAPEQNDGATAIRREITLVIDRSGSMKGPKIEQARNAALQVLAGLEPGEAFNVIAYNDTVTPLSPGPLTTTPENIAAADRFVRGLHAGGGTNLYDALGQALRPEPAEGMLPIVLFLTDGRPTVGQTSEVAIRDLAATANPFDRRVFTFGVGANVNVPLLEKIASQTRAAPTFVLPGEDVEAKVASVFRRLAGPVLADPVLAAIDEKGKPAVGRVHDVVPARLPDLFEGDQMVVLGRYSGSEPLAFDLRGNFRGRQRTFRFTFEMDKATARNGFVPRLWASRRIGVLVDAIRQEGADPRVATSSSVAADPRLCELMDEVVRLSTEFGIMTEYTSFLAREGSDLSRPDQVMKEARGNFVSRGMQTRSGLGAVNQGKNTYAQIQQQTLNYRNEFYDQAMNRVSVSSVQQVNDRAFYDRSGRWVDSRLVQREASIRPDEVIEFGSDRYDDLLRRLVSQGRQGVIALQGDILIDLDGRTILVKRPPAP